jgi:hypothetical protein
MAANLLALLSRRQSSNPHFCLLETYFCHSYRVISLQVNVVLPAFTVSFTSDFVQVLPTLCLLLDANAVPAVRQRLPLAMPSAKMAGTNRLATGFFIIVPFPNFSKRPGLSVSIRRVITGIVAMPLLFAPLLFAPLLFAEVPLSMDLLWKL